VPTINFAVPYTVIYARYVLVIYTNFILISCNIMGGNGW